MDLSNNEVTKEQGYKEFILEKFSKQLKSLDGYDPFIIYIYIKLCINIINYKLNNYYFREPLRNGKNETDSDSDEDEDGSESEGKVSLGIYFS